MSALTIPGGAEVSASQGDAISRLRALAVGDDDGREEAAGLEAGGDHGDQDQEAGGHHDDGGEAVQAVTMCSDKYYL